MSKTKKRIVIIAHNIRSTHNVGSILRTADGFGVEKVYLTGYSPYPRSNNDKRLPHLADRIDYQINKTALGAEKSVKCQYSENIVTVINNLRIQKYKIYALEQTSHSISLPNFRSSINVALVVGNETEGIDQKILLNTDATLEIPMIGKKESLNVSVATAVALYHLRYIA